VARQEIFSTEIRFDTDQIKNAIKEVERFRDSVLDVAKDIEGAFAKISLAGFAGKGLGIEIEKQTSQVKKLANEAGKAGKQISASFKKIELPDVFFEVQSQIRTLGDKTSPEINKIRDQFNRLRQDAKTGLKITGEVDPRTTREISELQNQLRKLKEAELRELEAQFGRVSQVGSLAGASIVGAFNEVTASADKLSQSRGVLDFGKALLEVNGNIQGFRSRLQDAVRLSGEGGDKLLALRTAMFGFGESTNIAARTLDFFTRSVGSGLKAQSEFARFGFRAAEEIAKFNNVLETNAKTFAVLAREQGVEAGRLNQLRRGIVEVENAFEKAGRAFARGRDATTQLLEAEQAANRFREEIQAIRQLGILDERSLRQLEELERSLTVANQGVKVLAVTQRQLKAEQDKAKQSAQALGRETKEMGDDAQRAGKSFTLFGGSLKTALGNLFSFGRGADQATREIRLMGQAAQTAGRAAADLFSGAFLGGFAGNLLFELGSRARFAFAELVELGSAAEELQNRFNVVFDVKSGIAAQVTEQLTLMADNFGRSVTDLKETASTFQDTFVPLGFSREEASRLSVALTSLTQDLSSFYNVSTKEAAERLASTLVGNTENMREFAVQINDAAISQELMNLGLASSTRNATIQQKTMAILSLSVKGVNDAIGDLKRSQNEFANTTRTASAVVKDLKEDLARQLLPQITPIVGALTNIAAIVGPRVIQVLTGLAEAFRPFAEAIAEALSTGNIDNLLNLFIDALENGINNAIDFLNSFIPVAFDWGANFVVEIANGIIETASDLLVDAVNYMASIISSFLAPGSPPEEGPLATIDQWARGLIETFDQGFKSADFDFLESTLRSISDAFTKQNFPEVKRGLVELVDEINRTGDFNTATFERVANQLGENNKELVKTLELQLAYQKARKAVLDIEDQVAEAERAGFVPKDLKDRLALAKKEEEQTKDQLSLQQKFLEFQELSLSDFKKSAAGAAGAAGRAARAGARAVKEAVNKQLEFVQSGFAEEKRLLDEKLAAGAISQEEYLQELISLEKKYIDASLREGLLGGLESHVENLNRAQAELAALRKESKKAIGLDVEGGISGDLIDQLTGGILSRSGALDIREKVKKLGQDISGTLLETIRDTFRERGPELGQALLEGFASIFTTISTKLETIFGGENGLLVGAIASVFVGAGAELVLGKIIAFATSVGGALGGLTGILRTLITIGARWSVIGGAIILIFQNWDKIVAAFNIVAAEASRIWAAFLENFGGGQKLIQDVQQAFEDITSSLASIFANVKQIVLDFITGDFVPTGKQLISSIFSGDLTAIGQNLRALIASIPLQDLFDALSLDNLNLSSLQTLVSNIANAIGATFRDALTGALGEGRFSQIATVFINIKDQIIDLFSDERLGGPLKELGADLIALFNSLKPLLEVTAQVIGGVLLLALNVVVSAFQSLVDILPNIETAIRGVIIIFDGLVQQLDGLIQILTGLGQLIVAIFRGEGFEEAFATLGSGFERFIEGIKTSFGGILVSLEGIAGSIINFIVSFGQNFIDNIVAFAEGTAVGQAFANLRDRILGFLGPIGSETGGIFEQAKTAISNAAQAVGDFFSEGRLGGEVILLFKSLGEAVAAVYQWVRTLLVPFGGLLGAMGEVAKFLGQTLLLVLNDLVVLIKVLLVPIIAVLVGAWNAFIDVLPLIERALAGLIKIIRGVIDVFTGVTQIITSVVQTIIALFTGGDFSRAQETFRKGFAKLGQGISNIFGGLLQTIVSLGLAIVQAVISFGAEFGASILGRFGKTGEQLASTILGYKDTFKNVFIGISDTVINILIGLGNQITQIFSLLGGKVVEALGGVGESIGTALQNSILGKLGGAAAEAANKVYTPIIEKAGEAGGAIGILSTAAENSIGAHDKLGISIGNIKNELVKSASAYANVGDETFRTNRAIAENEAALKKAEGAYVAQKIVVQKLEDALSAARRELLDLARPNLEGVEEFDDKLFELDQSAKKLQLALLDLEEGTPTFTSLKQELDRVNQEIDRVSLERDLAIEPQLRAIEKAATEGQVPLVNFDEAMAKIVTKKAEIEALETAFNKQTEALKPLAEAAEAARLALGGIGSEFGPNQITSPVEQATGGVFESFTRLQNDLVGNSVVPDTVNAIALNFSNMGLLVQQTATTMQFALTTIFNAIKTAWINNVQVMKTSWTQGITAIQSVAVAFQAQMLSILNSLRQAIDRVRQAIDQARSALEAFIDTFLKLAEVDLEDIVEAFDDIADRMDKAQLRAEKFAKFMNDAADAAERLSRATSGASAGGLPALQSGAWRIPRNMTAFLHQGEMVLPPDLAEQFRGFLQSLRATGVGDVSLPIAQVNAQSMTAGGNGDTIIVNASFPGVTNAREARGIEQMLDNLVARGRAFSAVGGNG
jgi:hypothetical protein